MVNMTVNCWFFSSSARTHKMTQFVTSLKRTFLSWNTISCNDDIVFRNSQSILTPANLHILCKSEAHIEKKRTKKLKKPPSIPTVQMRKKKATAIQS